MAKRKEEELEGLEAAEGFGAVDMFGLDEFGQAAGLNPVWGALAGAGLQSGAAAAIRAYAPEHEHWSETYGALAGAAAGGVMAAFPYTRAAGWTCIAVSLANGAIRQLEKGFTLKGVSVESLQGVSVESLQGFGETQVQQLNAPSIESLQGVPQLVGSQPTLVGLQGVGMGETQVQLNGSGGVSGLSSHFGANLFNKGN